MRLTDGPKGGFLMKPKNLFSELRNEIESIPLVDTHEHFILEQERQRLSLDLFYLIPH